MAHPVILIDLQENDFKDNLDGARIYLLFAIVAHFGKSQQDHFRSITVRGTVNYILIPTNIRTILQIQMFQTFTTTVFISFFSYNINEFRAS